MTRRLIVTTSPKPTPEMSARAQQVAERCGGEVVPRARGIHTLLQRHDAELCYVITRERESVHDRDDTFFVHPGLFYLKASDGRSHPLIRAVSPEGGAPLEGILDGTLGMAGDALHLAAILGVPILGVEASPVVASLAESAILSLGQARRRFALAAAHITVRWADTLELLRGMDPGAVDVVYLDPMFDIPLGAQPGFELLRRIGCAAPLSRALLVEAARVARRRVVVKVAGESPPPLLDPPAPGFNRWVRGQAVDYFVLDKERPPGAGEIPPGPP